MISAQAIAKQNRYLLQRQADLRRAADCVASGLARHPSVAKVALFGSVAVPLVKEIPRFREYRRAGIEVWHECKDLDLAVWLENLTGLREMRRIVSEALNKLLLETGIGVAHHQVDTFLFKQPNGGYLGRLCKFSQCPKNKPECLVPGCGQPPLLQQHEDFALDSQALRPQLMAVLYDRTLQEGIV
ncbi:MAG: hypothetical protein HY910_06035 [Desulfarculus sp.]|nr:hypothetical protein [Desulfarculus sp.]